MLGVNDIVITKVIMIYLILIVLAHIVSIVVRYEIYDVYCLIM